MEEKKQIVYILSALELNSENIELACSKRFQRITSDYILVYDESIPDGGVEISARDLKALSEQDSEWLAKCNMILINEFVEQHAESQKKSLQDFFDELDANIKKELKKD
jgi:adenine C2-methylase RlmN of 23S rRNA A2503 and tRNA A37